jgi:mevalonate kinase
MRGLAQTLDESLPDPVSNEFDNSVNALKRMLQLKTDDAVAANKFLPNSGDPKAADLFRTDKLARHMHARQQAEAGGESGGGGGGGGAIYIFPDEASAVAAVNAGGLHKGDKVKIGGPNGKAFTVGD